MVALPKAVHVDPTLIAADEALEATQAADEPRPYFGISTAGEPCARKAWLRFRWAKREVFAAATLKAFADGHLGETLQAERLRRVRGLELVTADELGAQYAVDGSNAHVRGHLDGAILGLLQAPKTWHVWEHKQVNDQKFAALRKAIEDKGEKDALEAWDEIYFVQAQLYMHGTGMRRHYLTCATPGGRATMSVRTEYQKTKAVALAKRCDGIVFAAEPPLRISEDPSWFACKWCSFHSLCHGTDAPAMSCRTCANATPQRDGSWTCALHNDEVLSVDAQRAGCDEHRYIPALLETFAELATADGNAVRWRNKLTGREFSQPDYRSTEIAAAVDKRLLGEEGVDKFKGVFGPVRIINTQPTKPTQRSEDDDFSDLWWRKEPT